MLSQSWEEVSLGGTSLKITFIYGGWVISEGQIVFQYDYDIGLNSDWTSFLSDRCLITIDTIVSIFWVVLHDVSKWYYTDETGYSAVRI